MVVMFSEVGQGGWCQETLPRPVLCHADQPGGKIGPHVRTGGRRGGGRPKSRSLTSGRLLAPGWLYLKSKQLTVSCKSRCVIEERMTRYLRAEWLIAPGGWGGSVYERGREKDSKPVNNPNINMPLTTQRCRVYFGNMQRLQDLRTVASWLRQ